MNDKQPNKNIGHQQQQQQQSRKHRIGCNQKPNKMAYGKIPSEYSFSS